MIRQKQFNTLTQIRKLLLREFRIADAKAECLDLATEFHAAVPREGRVMVYSYLYQSRPQFSEQLYRKIPELHCGDVDLSYMPHWQRKGAVGLEFS